MMGSSALVLRAPASRAPSRAGLVTRPGSSLIGDAAHLMSPLSGEGVNLTLADAVDLAKVLTSADPDAVATLEEAWQHGPSRRPWGPPLG